MLTPEEKPMKNKEICAILGIPYPEIIQDEIFGAMERYRDFCSDAGAVQLLRELKKWKYWKEFQLEKIGEDVYQRNRGWVEAIILEYITTPGLLAEKVLEWWKERR